MANNLEISKLKAAAYARYSTDNQTENSIAYQLSAINDYAGKNNILITHVFKDEGETGTNIDRKGYKNLLQAAVDQEFEAVIIYDITRGSRDVVDWFNFRKTMLGLGVQVISCTEQLGDLLDPGEFLKELITVGIGQHQVLTTRQKSREGVITKAKQGVFLGGWAPMGYKIVDGRYIVNEEEAKAVKMIFSLYALGYGYSEILAALAEGNYKTRFGRPFGKNSLNGILNNERYIGVYTWNKIKRRLMRKTIPGKQKNPDVIIINDAIPAIIDMETWRQVRDRMGKNVRKNKKSVREYLLSGMIRCGDCGALYQAHTAIKYKNGKKYENISYRCNNRYPVTRQDACRNANIPASEVETVAIEAVRDSLINQDFRSLAEHIAACINNNVEDQTKNKNRIKEIKEKISNGVKAILDGIDIPELKNEISNLRMELEILEKQVANAGSPRRQINVEALEEYFKIQAVAIKEPDKIERTKLREILRQNILGIEVKDGNIMITVGTYQNDFFENSGAKVGDVSRTPVNTRVCRFGRRVFLLAKLLLEKCGYAF